VNQLLVISLLPRSPNVLFLQFVNNGGRPKIPGTAEKRDSEQTMRKVTGMTTKIKKQ
jgi:hypothetical protein